MLGACCLLCHHSLTGVAHSFLRLKEWSGGAAVAMAVMLSATDELSRSGWALTGRVNLAGDICGVGGVREKVSGGWGRGRRADQAGP